MRIWRICKQRHVAEAFSGLGAEQVGGRWNPPGARVVYASSSLSLAALELFVHLEPGLIPDDLHAITAVLPDDVTTERLMTEDLPKDWRDYPAPIELQRIGSRWIQERRSLVLVVPSAVNPLEANCLVNPLHHEYPRITNIHAEPFQFDPRMWKSQ